MIKAVRGTRDLLPPETALWNFVEATVRDVFRVYNFHEIRTPIFEETQLFGVAMVGRRRAEEPEDTHAPSRPVERDEERGRRREERRSSACGTLVLPRPYGAALRSLRGAHELFVGENGLDGVPVRRQEHGDLGIEGFADVTCRRFEESFA